VRIIKKYTHKHLDELRHSTDFLGDQAVIDLMRNPDMASSINKAKNFSDLELLQFTLNIQEFFKFYAHPPDFIQRSKIELAQDYFQGNGSLYLSLLGLYSLPYCYAFADGAQVLYRSKRITSDIGNRLAETALFVLESFKPNTFIIDNSALLTLAKVRLIHSFARHFIIKYASDWDDQWGQPINQEDLLGTNLAFSVLVVRGLTKLGKFPGAEVYESILHYWKVIGWYLGLNIEYWPNSAKEAYELEHIIRKRHLKPSYEGEYLLQSLMKHFVKEIEGVGTLKEVESLISFFLGEEVSNVLNIKHHLILSPSLMGVFFNFNFKINQKPTTNYQEIRNEFNLRFKGEVELKIPVMRS